jgi:hypothetical protein
MTPSPRTPVHLYGLCPFRFWGDSRGREAAARMLYRASYYASPVLDGWTARRSGNDNRKSWRSALLDRAWARRKGDK